MSIPTTGTRLDHAVSIYVNSTKIGLIQEWSPQQSRGMTPIYELNSGTSGTILEYAPGNMSNQTITVNRYDLYQKRMEQAWGTGFNIGMLSDQSKSLTITEEWLNPDNTQTICLYEGCWFQQLGRTHSAQGDRITKVNASLVYTRKITVQQ
jgi:hypothetical protein